MSRVDESQASTGTSSDWMSELSTFNVENALNNLKIVKYSRTFMSIIGGVIAGVLGFTGWMGFAFYLVIMAINSAGLAAKAGFSVQSYFGSRNQIILDGFLEGLLIFVLFWTENANLIDSTCKETPNYQLCVSTLSKDPRSSTADIRILGLILVDALKSKAEEAVELINKLKKTSPEFRNALDRCSLLYYAILEADVPEAIEALTKGVPKFAENGVGDAVVEAQECEMGFEGLDSPLSGVNESVEDISNVGRAIIRMLL